MMEMFEEEKEKQKIWIKPDRVSNVVENLLETWTWNELTGVLVSWHEL